MKITVRKVKRYYAVGRLNKGQWSFIRTKIGGVPVQLIYGSRKKAYATARWVRKNATT